MHDCESVIGQTASPEPQGEKKLSLNFVRYLRDDLRHKGDQPVLTTRYSRSDFESIRPVVYRGLLRRALRKP